ncbi:MAG TPA: hypothetical protein VJC12_02690 [Candidatus Paceibacterota bacterium]
MKNFLIVGVIILILLVAGAWLSKTLSSKNGDIIAKGGIHWHPMLKIFISGKEYEIPQNIGLGAIHIPVHTHEDLPLIHLEFNGLVKKDDIKLGVFFRNWDKDMHSIGSDLKMTVNGKENSEYENYVMQDGDKIELYYN